MLLPDSDVRRHAVYRAVQQGAQHTQSRELTRRSFIAGAGSLTALTTLNPSSLGAQELSAERRFRIASMGLNIGQQTNRVTRLGNRLTSEVTINIDVKIFGVRLYRYRMRNTEVWESGTLMSIDSETVENDDDRDFTRARRNENGLSVEGSKFQGIITEDVATTTYWTKAFLERKRWISTQGGEQYDVRFSAPEATEYVIATGRVPSTRYRVMGDLPINLFYDQNEEWLGTTFKAQGRSVRIFALERNQRLAPLWFDT